MNEIKTMQEAYRVFDLLGIKEVTKECQRRKGTEVWELPFKTMYSGGYKEVNRFTIYKNGYIRKMLVNNKGASYTCYQLNKVRKVPNFVEDRKWDSIKNESYWTGKYCKQYGNERIMIPEYEDRIVYLCNYILKNYYRSQKGASFYRINDYQVSLMKRNQEDSCELDKIRKPHLHNLPFEQHNSHGGCEYVKSEDSKHGISPNHSVQVIIDGHRYNLS